MMMETNDVESSPQEECGDDERHSQLLEAIGSLGRRKRKGGGRETQLRSEGSATVSEFHLSCGGGEGGEDKGAATVSVGELLAGLGTDQGHLKKRLRAVRHRTGAVPTPLHKHQAEKIQRTVAYREASKQVAKWVPIVKKSRHADRLTFPLQDEQPPPPSLTSQVESFKPVTEMEREIAAVLEGSENVDRDEEELTQAERKALLRMSLEEANERLSELKKMRALMSYYEQKCRRVKRIKSKRFHRIQRKRRDALTGRRGEEEGEEAIEKAERIRANERMTLKHSNMSKWARQQLARGHRDPATQQALTDHHHIKRELTQKTVQENDSESEGSVCSEPAPSGDEEGDMQSASSSGGNPWFTAGNRRSPEPVLLLDSVQVGGGGEGDGGGRGTSGSGGRERGQGEEEDLPTDFEPEMVNEGGEEEEEEEVTGETMAAQRTVPPTSKHIDPTSYMVTREEGQKGRGSLGKASDHLLNVQEAFAGEDVVGEFQQEKEEEEEKSKPKVTDLSLPGWGSWGGMGTNPRKRKKTEKAKPTPPQKPRRDRGLRHVIINEERDKKSAKHQVSTLPWPYTSREQFDKTHCTPVGRHWNSEATFQSMITPRVSTAIGTVIQPIRLTEDVRSFMKRTENKGRREGRGGGRKRSRGDVNSKDREEAESEQKRKKEVKKRKSEGKKLTKN